MLILRCDDCGAEEEYTVTAPSTDICPRCFANQNIFDFARAEVWSQPPQIKHSRGGNQSKLLDGTLFLNAKELGEVFGVGESQARNILAMNPQLSLRIGHRILIPTSAVREFLGVPNLA